MPPGYLEVFAQFGVPGLVIGLQYVWIWRQEKRLHRTSEAYEGRLQKTTEAYESRVHKLTDDLRLEQSARVEDAKAYTNLALDLQKRVIEAVATISDTLASDDYYDEENKDA